MVRLFSPYYNLERDDSQYKKVFIFCLFSILNPNKNYCNINYFDISSSGAAASASTLEIGSLRLNDKIRKFGGSRRCFLIIRYELANRLEDGSMASSFPSRIQF